MYEQAMHQLNHSSARVHELKGQTEATSCNGVTLAKCHHEKIVCHNEYSTKFDKPADKKCSDFFFKMPFLLGVNGVVGKHVMRYEIAPEKKTPAYKRFSCRNEHKGWTSGYRVKPDKCTCEISDVGAKCKGEPITCTQECPAISEALLPKLATPKSKKKAEKLARKGVEEVPAPPGETPTYAGPAIENLATSIRGYLNFGSVWMQKRRTENGVYRPPLPEEEIQLINAIRRDMRGPFDVVARTLFSFNQAATRVLAPLKTAAHLASAKCSFAIPWALQAPSAGNEENAAGKQQLVRGVRYCPPGKLKANGECTADSIFVRTLSYPPALLPYRLTLPMQQDREDVGRPSGEHITFCEQFLGAADPTRRPQPHAGDLAGMPPEPFRWESALKRLIWDCTALAFESNGRVYHCSNPDDDNVAPPKQLCVDPMYSTQPPGQVPRGRCTQQETSYEQRMMLAQMASDAYTKDDVRDNVASKAALKVILEIPEAADETGPTLIDCFIAGTALQNSLPVNILGRLPQEPFHRISGTEDLSWDDLLTSTTIEAPAPFFGWKLHVPLKVNEVGRVLGNEVEHGCPLLRFLVDINEHFGVEWKLWRPDSALDIEDAPSESSYTQRGKTLVLYPPVDDSPQGYNLLSSTVNEEGKVTEGAMPTKYQYCPDTMRLTGSCPNYLVALHLSAMIERILSLSTCNDLLDGHLVYKPLRVVGDEGNVCGEGFFPPNDKAVFEGAVAHPIDTACGTLSVEDGQTNYYMHSISQEASPQKPPANKRNPRVYFRYGAHTLEFAVAQSFSQAYGCPSSKLQKKQVAVPAGASEDYQASAERYGLHGFLARVKDNRREFTPIKTSAGQELARTSGGLGYPRGSFFQLNEASMCPVQVENQVHGLETKWSTYNTHGNEATAASSKAVRNYACPQLLSIWSYGVSRWVLDGAKKQETIYEEVPDYDYDADDNNYAAK
jgi:hypothetical protein